MSVLAPVLIGRHRRSARIADTYPLEFWLCKKLWRIESAVKGIFREKPEHLVPHDVLHAAWTRSEYWLT